MNYMLITRCYIHIVFVSIALRLLINPVKSQSHFWYLSYKNFILYEISIENQIFIIGGFEQWPIPGELVMILC